MSLRQITSGNLQECYNVANGLYASGSTCISCGLYSGLAQLDTLRDSTDITSKTLLLLSDGVPNVSNNHYSINCLKLNFRLVM